MISSSVSRVVFTDDECLGIPEVYYYGYLRSSPICCIALLQTTYFINELFIWKSVTCFVYCTLYFLSYKDSKRIYFRNGIKKQVFTMKLMGAHHSQPVRTLSLSLRLNWYIILVVLNGINTRSYDSIVLIFQ